MKQKDNIVNRTKELYNNTNRRDCVYTPEELAINLIKKIPIEDKDILLDPSSGQKVFYRNFPIGHKKYECEIERGSNFFKFDKKVDWIISNPPYSILNKFLDHSYKLSNKGIAFLLGSYSITPKRLELMEKAGFRLYSLHYLKVSNWFGIQCFAIFKKYYSGDCNITYSRKVYQCSNHIKRHINQQTLAK